MKKVIIVHGWGGSPNETMLQWLKSQLENNGFEVNVPAMPNTDEPQIEAWVNKIKEVSSPDTETFYIGHSIGCQAILRYLEDLESGVKVGGAVLIAPWMHLDQNTIEEDGEEVIEIAEPWMETPINFKKVKSHVKNVTAIFSDNDLYVPLSGKDLFEKELNAKIIIENNKGHFIEKDVQELPSALEAILIQSSQ